MAAFSRSPLADDAPLRRCSAISRIPRSTTFLLLGAGLYLLCQGPAFGGEVQFEHGLGGALASVVVAREDSLVELARTYDIGYSEITAANPGVDPFVPEVGTRITIPTEWILPEVEKPDGIVINLSEFRLYFFRSSRLSTIDTYPIGIGDEGWDTPLGTYRIIEKIRDPAWHVPESIRNQKPELPKVVPPGPDNPLGTHALRLSIGTVLIHGTDRPYGIGRRVSHGCIHLYPEDVVRLFGSVRVGTRVTIVRQPVKAALVKGRIWVEVHGGPEEELQQEALDLVVRKGLIDRTDVGKLERASREKSGIPIDVTLD